MKKLIRINLGCGEDFSDELIGFDLYDYGQQYKEFDLEKDKLPFKDNEVDYIFANHSLEHLKEVKHILNEAWRVLKKDGIFEATAPYGLWPGASKPVHYQMITLSWFDFLRKEKTKIYGYKKWIIEYLALENNDSEVRCKMKPDK